MLTILSFYLYPGWYLLQGQSRGRNTRNCLSNPTYFSLRSQNDKKTCRKSEIWDKLLPKIQKMSQNFPLSESPRMSPVYMYLVIKNQNLQPSDPIWSVEHFLYLANSLATIIPITTVSDKMSQLNWIKDRQWIPSESLECHVSKF